MEEIDDKIYFQTYVITPSQAAHDRITILQPKIENQSAGIVVLKTKKYENFWGCLLAGEAGRLEAFNVQLNGMEGNWAQLDETELFQKLVHEAKAQGLDVVYEHSPDSLTEAGDMDVPSQKPSGTGPGYRTFGPPMGEKNPFKLAQVLDEAEAMLKSRSVKGDTVPPLSRESYPKHITSKGKKFWDYVLEQYGAKLASEDDAKKQWALAIAYYITICQKRGVVPFEQFDDGKGGSSRADAKALEKKLNAGASQSESLLYKVEKLFERLGDLKEVGEREIFETGLNQNGIYVIGLAKSGKMIRDSDKINMGRELVKNYGFRKKDKDYYVYAIDGMTQACVQFDKCTSYFITYSYLTKEQVRVLMGDDGGAEDKELDRFLRLAADSWNTTGNLLAA